MKRYTVPGKMLRGDLSEGATAYGTLSHAMVALTDADRFEGLSQEFAPKLDITPESVRQASNKVLNDRSIIVDLGHEGLGWFHARLLLEFLDLMPDSLVGAQGLLKGSSLQPPFLDDSQYALGLLSEPGQVTESSS
jgi:hypothetical protein